MCILGQQAGHLELDGSGSLSCNSSTFLHMICHSLASYFGLDLIAESGTQHRKEKRTILFSAFNCLRFSVLPLTKASHVIMPNVKVGGCHLIIEQTAQIQINN